MEAFYWIARLGTFERAANRLNTTQSAISKRIQELEASVGLPMFDRTQRNVRLTEKGDHLVVLADEMFKLRERILNLKSSSDAPAYRLRIGVTELSAMTWFPRLISKIREDYPRVVVEPHVSSSCSLEAMLHDDALDLIVAPEVFTSEEVTYVRLSDVSHVWMATPGFVPTDETLKLDRLSEYSLVLQGAQSGTGIFYNRWLRSQGVSLSHAIFSDNLTALIGFAAAGVGVSYLPRQCLQPLIDEGKLAIVPAVPLLPPIPYSAFYKSDRPSSFISLIAELMCDVCDFTRQLQTGLRPAVSVA